ncbi:MAG: metallophosphoesterase [Lachnospiraceae bacterium]|nr:metallophosphoesterase [Lachnospiraceae bacterium]
MKIREYTVKTDKLSYGDKVCFLFVSDLHGQAAERGGEILSVLRKRRPDAFLLGGDQISTRGTDRTESVCGFLAEAAAILPVFAVDGNHETRLRVKEKYKQEWERIRQSFSGTGAAFLHNTAAVLPTRPEIRIAGFEAPLGSYRKLRRPYLPEGAVTEALGRCDGRFTVLLAHNPAFAGHYFAYGADLILAGHYHGGIVRFGRQVLISPYGFPFPKYGYGLYRKDSSTLIVSSGAGDHGIPLRICNPYEMIWITVEGEGHGDHRKS